MFEDLDWKGAVKRAVFAAALYVLFIYVMTVAFPESFGASTNIVSTLVVAVAFFLIYTPFFAFAERRKRRRLAEMRAQQKGKSGSKTGARAKAEAKAGTTQGSGPDDEEAGEGNLRGRHNPNTSRRKATRRRRR
jgi:flagellar biosynthesis/type III secretory pathway M-ring protein FliF/YscJ